MDVEARDDTDPFKLERETDRQEGDNQHNPPCQNCQSRDLACFTPAGRLFGMRCRRCERIKKHCTYSKVKRAALIAYSSSDEDEESEDEEIPAEEWTNRPRRLRSSSRQKKVQSPRAVKKRKVSIMITLRSNLLNERSRGAHLLAYPQFRRREARRTRFKRPLNRWARL